MSHRGRGSRVRTRMMNPAVPRQTGMHRAERISSVPSSRRLAAAPFQRRPDPAGFPRSHFGGEMSGSRLIVCVGGGGMQERQSVATGKTWPEQELEPTNANIAKSIWRVNVPLLEDVVCNDITSQV